jgi:hypothetical protein
MDAIDILTHLNVGYVEPDEREEIDAARERLVRTLSRTFGRGELTGGADWSARYVWFVSKEIASILGGLPTVRGGEAAIYLVWSDGDLWEPLEFLLRTSDEDLGEYVDEPLRDLNLIDLRRLERAGLIR